MRNRTAFAVTAGLAAALAVAASGCASSGSKGATASHASSAARSSTVLAAASSPGTITTQGQGTVSGTDDTMTITIDVNTSAFHAASALGENNTISAAVQQALERDGVTAADIQTTNLSLQQTTNSSGTPTGYSVDDTVSATLDHLAVAGKTIDDAVAAAGDAGRLDGVSFSISNTSPLLAAARAQAVEAARAQAVQLASAAGVQLVSLRSLTVDVQQPQTPVYNGFAEALPASTVPVQPGTQQLTENVTEVWNVIS